MLMRYQILFVFGTVNFQVIKSKICIRIARYVPGNKADAVLCEALQNFFSGVFTGGVVYWAILLFLN